MALESVAAPATVPVTIVLLDLGNSNACWSRHF
jgi:hypothetical protein